VLAFDGTDLPEAIILRSMSGDVGFFSSTVSAVRDLSCNASMSPFPANASKNVSVRRASWRYLFLEDPWFFEFKVIDRFCRSVCTLTYCSLGEERVHSASHRVPWDALAAVLPSRKEVPRKTRETVDD
jgi:hypothetical protein